MEHLITKTDGSTEPFDPMKLKLSLEKAGASVITAEEVAKEITDWIVEPVTTNAIYKKAFKLLHEKEGKAPALRYSLRRSITELGPTGFPFEQFIAAILRKKGYAVETGSMVQGKCVDHEVDIVAWNQKELLLGEVKFHSDLGAKSDLKVALYIKSRFDDLKTAKVVTPDAERQMTDGMLITNTKFTQKAIEYGNCAGVNMIGWNYPAKGSLHDLINETGIHPVTCLPSLDQTEKQFIIGQKIVDCETFINSPGIFDMMPSLAKKKTEIIADAESICGL